MNRLFPWAITILYLLSALGSAAGGEWKKSLYSLSAAALTWSALL